MPGYRAPALRRVALTVAMLAGFAGPVSADPVADFYRGRTIEIDVGTGGGGGYDQRLAGSAPSQRLLPGNPTVIVNNLPGGGGIRAAIHCSTNRSATARCWAPSAAMITEPMLGSGRTVRSAKLTWIGSASREDGLCLATPSSSANIVGRPAAEGRDRGHGAPAPPPMYPVMLRNLFGARSLVSGYPDGGQIALAIERNEVQAVCQTYSSLAIGHPAWLRDRVVQPLIGLGLGRIADLPDIPSVMELATTDEQRQVLKVVLAPTLAGRPFVAPPGIPADRAIALRQAFDAMTRDPGFLEEARRLHMDVAPATGGEIEALVKEIYALPKAGIATTKRVGTNGETGR